MTAAQNYLGLDLDLLDEGDARAKIIKACAKCWFDRNPTGAHNWGDCSGFVKAVQKELHLPPFTGRANDIYHEVERRSDWVVIGSGSAALARAGAAANGGALTIGVWESPRGEGQVGWAHQRAAGHVAIVTAYLPLLGHKPEQHAIAGWGQLGGVGQLLGRLSLSFGHGKHGSIRYAQCVTPIV